MQAHKKVQKTLFIRTNTQSDCVFVLINNVLFILLCVWILSNPCSAQPGKENIYIYGSGKGLMFSEGNDFLLSSLFYFSGVRTAFEGYHLPISCKSAQRTRYSTYAKTFLSFFL